MWRTQQFIKNEDENVKRTQFIELRYPEAPQHPQTFALNNGNLTSIDRALSPVEKSAHCRTLRSKYVNVSWLHLTVS